MSETTGKGAITQIRPSRTAGPAGRPRPYRVRASSQVVVNEHRVVVIRDVHGIAEVYEQ